MADEGRTERRKKPSPPPPPVASSVGPAVALVNESSLSPGEVSQMAAALQIQVSRDFGPDWGTDCRLYTIGNSPGAWPIHLVDYPGAQDPANALGYHDLGADGLPYARVFVGTAKDNGVKPSSVVSHELLEMLGDPFVYSTVFVQDSDTTGTLFMVEACDAPERESYDIGGFAVSNYVRRNWWIPGSHGPWDHLGSITAPLRLRSGGYIGTFGVTAGTGWGQQMASAPARLAVQVGGYREPRHVQWIYGDDAGPEGMNC